MHVGNVSNSRERLKPYQMETSTKPDGDLAIPLGDISRAWGKLLQYLGETATIATRISSIASGDKHLLALGISHKGSQGLAVNFIILISSIK